MTNERIKKEAMSQLGSEPIISWIQVKNVTVRPTCSVKEGLKINYFIL
jgi:hypothetical protein